MRSSARRWLVASDLFSFLHVRYIWVTNRLVVRLCIIESLTELAGEAPCAGMQIPTWHFSMALCSVVMVVAIN